MPLEGNFKVLRPGGRDGQRSANSQDTKEQRRCWAKYLQWAFTACGVGDVGFRAFLKEASARKECERGKAGLPLALQRHDNTQRVTVREHAVLLCSAEGFRSAAKRAASFLGREEDALLELDRLLNLTPSALRAEGKKLDNRFWQAASHRCCDADGTIMSFASRDTRLQWCCGLFEAWIFAQTAQRLGVAKEWQGLMTMSKWEKIEAPTKVYLNGETFDICTSGSKLAPTVCAHNSTDSHKFRIGKGALIASWWRLAWDVARRRVDMQYKDDRRRRWHTDSTILHGATQDVYSLESN